MSTGQTGKEFYAIVAGILEFRPPIIDIAYRENTLKALTAGIIPPVIPDEESPYEQARKFLEKNPMTDSIRKELDSLVTNVFNIDATEKKKIHMDYRVSDAELDAFAEAGIKTVNDFGQSGQIGWLIAIGFRTHEICKFAGIYEKQIDDLLDDEIMHDLCAREQIDRMILDIFREEAQANSENSPDENKQELHVAAEKKADKINQKNLREQLLWLLEKGYHQDEIRDVLNSTRLSEPSDGP